MSRIDMMAPRTTTPATSSTLRSRRSLPGGAVWECGEVSVLTQRGYGPGPSRARYFPSVRACSWSRPGRRHGLDGVDEPGVLRLHAGAEPGDHGAVGGDQELLEVPRDVVGLAVLVGGPHEGPVDLVAALAVDVDLLGHRERHAVRRRAEL